MIALLSIFFLIVGIIFSSADIFIPVYPKEFLIVILTFRIFGMMFSFIGLLILGMRIYQTDVGMWLDLPSDRIIPLIHSHIRGHDPDARFLRGRRVDLETIKYRKKTFKDMGGGFRIAGHSVRRTYETIGFTVPDWLSAYLHEIKETYGLKNSDEFKELKTQLKTLRDIKEQTTTPYKTIEEQLNSIELLKPVMSEPAKKSVLLGMSTKQLRNLELLLYDGITHNGDEVELFIDSATPNEVDVLETQTFQNEMQRLLRYKDKGQVDWGKYMPWMVVMMFAVVIVFLIMKGM